MIKKKIIEIIENFRPQKPDEVFASFADQPTIMEGTLVCERPDSLGFISRLEISRP